MKGSASFNSVSLAVAVGLVGVILPFLPWQYSLSGLTILGFLIIAYRIVDWLLPGRANVHAFNTGQLGDHIWTSAKGGAGPILQFL